MTNSFEHYSLNTQFGAEDELFKAIMTLDKGRVQELKANGASLTENVRKVLESGSGRKQNTSDPAVELYFNFIRMAVLPVCMSTPHVCSVHSGVLHNLELEI